MPSGVRLTRSGVRTGAASARGSWARRRRWPQRALVLLAWLMLAVSAAPAVDAPAPARAVAALVASVNGARVASRPASRAASVSAAPVPAPRPAAFGAPARAPLSPASSRSWRDDRRLYLRIGTLRC